VHPRVGVKAIVIHNGRLVTVKKHDDRGPPYGFPGGGQEAGETLVQAVRREFIEETGQDIHVGRLLFVREYIGKNHEHAATDVAVHVVDHLFLCALHDPLAPLHALTPDDDQAGVEWLPVAYLADYRFFPRALMSQLIEIACNAPRSGPIYVGDVN